MAQAISSGVYHRYPDREFLRLRTQLADYLGHGLGPANIWAANGSNEVMTHVLGAFGGPGRRMLTFTPTYSMYPEYARNTHTEYVTAPLVGWITRWMRPTSCSRLPAWSRRSS